MGIATWVWWLGGLALTVAGVVIAVLCRGAKGAEYPDQNLGHGSAQFGSKYAEALADHELAEREKS